MTKNKRKQASLEETLERPWCYYCERDFDDLKILINHQKAKHMKCSICPRRLNTAGGLSVHMQQVHKETLNRIENANPGREDPNVEIFGMEGIPEDVRVAHDQLKTQEFYAAEADHRERSGNNAQGQGAAKKIKVETPEEIKKRLAEFKARKAAGELATPGSGPGTPGAKPVSPANAQVESPFQVPAAGSPANAYNTAFTQPPAASPPMAYGHQFGQPPMSGAPYAPQYSPPNPGFGMPVPPGPPMPYPGFNGSPPPHAQYVPPFPPQQPPQPFPQPFNSSFPPPTPPNGHGFGARAVPHHPPHANAGANQHVPRPNPPPGGPPRQNSLPSAAGLPARPAFDAPLVSRSQLNEMHQGQKPVPTNFEASAISSGVDDLIAEAQSQAHTEQNHHENPADKHPDEHKGSMSPHPGRESAAINGHGTGAAEHPHNVGQANKSSNGTNGETAKTTSPTVAEKVSRPEVSKSTPTKGEKTKKRVVMMVKDEEKTPEEKMATMNRYSFPIRQRPRP